MKHMDSIESGQRKLNDILNRGRVHRQLFTPLISVLVVLNIVVLFLNTLSQLQQFDLLFDAITYFSGFVFLTEYALRIWTAPLAFPHDRQPRLRYLLSFNGLVDLISVLPFAVPLLFPHSAELREVIDFSRLFLVFKLTRDSRSFSLLRNVLKEARPKLLIAFTLSTVLISFFAMAMYYIERDAQPEVFANIGDGYWWAIITFATVGYGDAVPVTALGKVLASIIAIVGISMFALPTAIFSSTLMEHMNRHPEDDRPDRAASCPERDGEDSTPYTYCPHCGKKLREKAGK